MNDDYEIRRNGHLVATVRQIGKRHYVTAEYGSKRGQSIGVVSDETGARAAVNRYVARELELGNG